MGERGRAPRVGLAAGAAAAAMLALSPAFALQAHAQQTNSISIAAQDLDAALRALARETGVQIIFAPDLVDHRRAAATRGARSPEEALRRMLSGSGLTFRMTGPHTFTILAQPARPAQSAGNADDPALSEIVVTAQRRAQNLQEVPIAVATVSGATLENSSLAATRDLPQLMPSVQMTRSGPSGLFFIRGVGTTNAAAGEEGSNAMYVDDVYIGDLGQTINYFNNIDHVEVLRGPQGTLFGRNATGGLIHVITRTPGDTLQIHSAVGAANYDTQSGQFYIGGPLAHTLSADLAFTASHQHEGWGRNFTLNTDNHLGHYDGVRTKVVWDAADALHFTFSADHFESEENWGLGWRTADGVLGYAGTPSPGGHNTLANTPSLTDLEIQGASLTGTLDLGFATLTSITARREFDNRSAFDVDGGPYDRVNISYVSGSNTLQQELRLASNGADPLAWQVGAFYLHSEASTDQFQLGQELAAVGDGFHIISNLATNSYALFGEATYAVTPSTDLTAGVRYTVDHRDLDARRITILSGGGIGATAISPYTDLDYDELTYRLAVRHELSDTVSVYASFNHSFKAGTFNLQSPLTAPARPQFIDAYEIGWKSELLDHRLRLNLAGYHYNIDDYQVRSAVTGGGSSILLNAATVEVDGVDLEFEALLDHNFTLFGGATALDSRFEKFGGPGTTLQAPITYPSPATCTAPGTHSPGTITGPPTGGVTTCYGDVSGNATPLAPDLTVSLGATYTLALGDMRELRMTGLYTYNSGFAFESDNRQRQAAFNVFNGSVEYRFNRNFGIEFWGRNLFDEEYAAQKVTTATVTQVLAAPRTYGVNFRLDF